MEYMKKISESVDRKGTIMEILSQMGASYHVQQFPCVENIVVPFHEGNERLVIGAHWDAVEGSDGANDNASGCSILLHVIEAVLSVPTFQKRVDFVFFGEEEKGGVGSSHYIESVGKENVRAMVNVDICGFGDQILLYDKGNVSNSGFGGVMDEGVLKAHRVQLPGYLPQGDDYIFEASEIPSVSICTADPAATAVFSEIGRKLATDQPITEEDQEAFMCLDIVKTMHCGELDDISHLNGEAVKMVADFLSDGLLHK